MRALLNCTVDEQVEELWFQLHGSDHFGKRMAALSTCYLDDSGEQAKTVILGGCVLDKDAFIRLEKQWANMLHSYRVDGLHMADCSGPHFLDTKKTFS